MPGPCSLLGKYKETWSLSEFPFALESQSLGSGSTATLGSDGEVQGKGKKWLPVRGCPPCARPAKLVPSAQQTRCVMGEEGSEEGRCTELSWALNSGVS